MVVVVQDWIDDRLGRRALPVRGRIKRRLEAIAALWSYEQRPVVNWLPCAGARWPPAQLGRRPRRTSQDEQVIATREQYSIGLAQLRVVDAEGEPVGNSEPVLARRVERDVAAPGGAVGRRGQGQPAMCGNHAGLQEQL